MAVIVVMGVSGVGKTTVGQALASAIQAEFAEGDSYHPEENVEKMRRGQPLSDDDRWPWLDRLRAEIDDWLRKRKLVVLTCSALKASYRERLRAGPSAGSFSPDTGDVAPDAACVWFVYLRADRNLIGQRLAARKGHYMPASLLDSQLDALEPPKNAITVDTNRSLDDIIADLTAQFAGRHNGLPKTASQLTKS
ncbi:MAG: gluconokinase [Geminicoccaceae bacterium]